MKVGQIVNITAKDYEKVCYSQPIADDMGGNVEYLDLSFQMTPNMTLTGKVLNITDDLVECEMIGFDAHIYFDKSCFNFEFDNDLTAHYYQKMRIDMVSVCKLTLDKQIYEYDGFSVHWSNISGWVWVEIDGEVICRWR